MEVVEPTICDLRGIGQEALAASKKKLKGKKRMDRVVQEYGDGLLDKIDFISTSGKRYVLTCFKMLDMFHCSCPGWERGHVCGHVADYVPDRCKDCTMSAEIDGRCLYHNQRARKQSLYLKPNIKTDRDTIGGIPI